MAFQQTSGRLSAAVMNRAAALAQDDAAFATEGTDSGAAAASRGGDVRAARAPHRDFLPFVAHELRNSLSVVRTAAFRLRDVTIDGPALVSTRLTIERHLEQMARLVDELLTASRESQAEIALDLERVDLRAVVREPYRGWGSSPSSAARR